MSRSHLQCYVVPEHNGKLNGKWFSSRANMVKLNNSIHRMAQEQFGVMFMDGSKRKSRKTVEQLKNESAYLAIQQELDAQKMALDTQTAEVKKTAHGQSSRSRIYKKIRTGMQQASALHPCSDFFYFSGITARYSESSMLRLRSLPFTMMSGFTIHTPVCTFRMKLAFCSFFNVDATVCLQHPAPFMISL